MGMVINPFGFGPPPFDPATLFAGGVAGAWYDPSDLSSMFQDTSASTPAAVNSIVRRMNDKSGNGNTATAINDARSPTLRQAGSLFYLDFIDAADGTNEDYMTASALAMTQSNDIASAWRFDTVASPKSLFDGSISRQTMYFNPTGTLNIYANGNGVGPSVSTGTDYVFVGRFNGASSSIRTNGVTASAVNASTGNLSGLVLGANFASGSFIDGRFYGMIARDTIFDSTELAHIDTYLGAKAGLTL